MQFRIQCVSGSRQCPAAFASGHPITTRSMRRLASRVVRATGPRWCAMRRAGAMNRDGSLSIATLFRALPSGRGRSIVVWAVARLMLEKSCDHPKASAPMQTFSRSRDSRATFRYAMALVGQTSRKRPTTQIVERPVPLPIAPGTVECRELLETARARGMIQTDEGFRRFEASVGAPFALATIASLVAPLAQIPLLQDPISARAADRTIRCLARDIA